MTGFSWHHSLKFECLNKEESKFDPAITFVFSNNLRIQKSVQSEFFLNRKKNELESRIILFVSLKKSRFCHTHLNVRQIYVRNHILL